MFLNVCKQTFHISHVRISQKLKCILMWNLKDVFFIWRRRYWQILKAALVYLESAKLRVLGAKNVLTCQRALRGYYSRANVPCVLTCSRSNVPWVLTYSRANVPCVLTCSHVNVVCVLTYSHANVLIVLHRWVLYLGV